MQGHCGLPNNIIQITASGMEREQLPRIEKPFDPPALIEVLGRYAAPEISDQLLR
jgi:hypothetical protein